jgi:hypothetical protein
MKRIDRNRLSLRPPKSLPDTEAYTGNQDRGLRKRHQMVHEREKIGRELGRKRWRPLNNTDTGAAAGADCRSLCLSLRTAPARAIVFAILLSVLMTAFALLFTPKHTLPELLTGLVCRHLLDLRLRLPNGADPGDGLRPDQFQARLGPAAPDRSHPPHSARCRGAHGLPVTYVEACGSV